MKKIMLVVAIVCAAMMTQAASMKWTALNVKSDNTGSANANNYVMYTFLGSASAGSAATLAKVTTISAITSMLGSDGDVAKALGYSLSSGTVKNGLGNVSTAYADDAWNDTTSQSTFAVVFNAATAADATEFLVVPAGGTATAVTFTDKDNLKSVAFGSQASNLNWTAIAVPEPTSGLLMLIGMAGLALRRRRA